MDFAEEIRYSINKIFMIRKFRILPLLFLSVFAIGCTTQSILIKAYTPASLELPPEVRTFSVFSRFVPAQGEYDRVIWGAYDSIDSVMLAASDTCYKSFSELFNSYDRYMTRLPEGERMFRHNGAELPDPLPWEGLVKIAKRQRTEALVMLESFDLIESDIKVIPQADSYLAEIEIIISVGWRIYQPSRRRIFDEKVYKHIYMLNGEGNSEAAAIADLPERSERLILAGVFAGKEYASLMKPGIAEIKRKYYIKGHHVIEESAVFAANDEWSKAKAKWDYNAYKGETDHLKAMCSYNMSLIAEKDGHINKALGFARRAQKYMPSKLHLELINKLIKKSFELDELYKSGKIIKNW